MTKFTKAAFARFFAKRYNLSNVEGQKLFDAIGREIDHALSSGGEARLFGIGTIKLRPRPNACGEFIRFREAAFRTKRAERKIMRQVKQSLPNEQKPIVKTDE
jgi:nucleoid DNA-binding protein